MAQQQTIIKRFDLTNGFITEATELTFPESATVDESNFTIENDGSRKRRLGLDYESNYVLHSSDTWQDGDAVTLFEWRSVGGDADTNFVVVQVGKTLHFYDRDNDSFSNNKIADTVDLAAHKVSGRTDTQVRQSRIDAQYGRARFFVVGEFLDPFYIEWDGANISTTSITIQERDFEGLDDGLGVSTRPSNLSEKHLYNLRNQGWLGGRIETFQNAIGSYPSNADIWHFGKYLDSSNNGKEAFSAQQVVDQDFGNTHAPQGHFIHNIFDTTQSFAFTNTINISGFTHDGSTATVDTASNHGLTVGDTFVIDSTSFSYTDNDGNPQTYTYSIETHTVASVTDSDTFTFDHDITNFDTSDPQASFDTLDTNGSISYTINNPDGETTDARPVSVSFFAGRAWWGGIPDDRLGNKVFFSQIIQFEGQIGKCYQEADPTSEHISDLIDTDGGAISISEMGQVLKMVVVGKNLALFADNGIWTIGPGQEGFFTATSFSIRKISNVNIASPTSVVVAEGTPLVWAYQGIYALGEDQVSGFLNAQTLTANTIQTFYQNIPDASKERSFATYDDVSKKFFWVYSSDSANPDKLDRCLIFDAKHEAFQKYDFKSITDGPFVGALTTTLGYDAPDNKVKLFTIVESNGNFAFSNFNETTFHDWLTHDSTGVDANGYLVTGYETGEDAGRDKQTPVITLLFRRTETGTNASGELTNPGSCFMQARWDWADSSNSNKWNPERQVYRLRRTYFTGSHPSSTFEDGYPVVWSRNKVRGRGTAFNMKLRTEEDHDLHLLGWQIKMTGGTES